MIFKKTTTFFNWNSVGLFFDGARGFDCYEEFGVLFLLTRRRLYPLFIRCVVSALERVLKNSSVEQILLSHKALLKEMDYLVWDGWQDDLRRY